MQALRARITSLSSKTSAAAAARRSSPHSEKVVFTDISNGIHPFLRRSFGAHDSREPQRRRSSSFRMPRDERRALVKDFVDRYMALNAGKFPTPSEAKREVGGSYYTIKKLVQELEYNSKMSSTITIKKDEVSLEELPKEESLASVDVAVLPCSKTGPDLTYSTKSLESKHESQNVVTNNMDTDEVSSTSISFEARKEALDSFKMLSSEDIPSATKTGDPSDFDENHIHQIDLESKKASHLGNDNPASCEKKASTSDGSLDLNEPKHVQVVVQEVFELDKLENKGVTVSHLGNEDADDSKKKAATFDGSLNLKEPQLVPEAAQDSINLGNKEVSDLFIEDSEKSNEKSATSGSSLDFNESKVDLGEWQEAYKSEKLESPRDVSRNKNEEHQLPNKTTMWGNLRSFAEGVMNLWKKL